jgi:Predicted transcriptional regulators
MDIIISNAVNQPIYEQIYTQIKNQIISGKLAEDEMLTSIRALAKDLRISVITTKRAYDELEKEGFIYARSGKGFFVAKKDLKLVREGNLKLIEEYLQKISALAEACSLEEDEIIEMYRVIKEQG